MRVRASQVSSSSSTSRVRQGFMGWWRTPKCHHYPRPAGRRRGMPVLSDLILFGRRGAADWPKSSCPAALRLSRRRLFRPEDPFGLEALDEVADLALVALLGRN